MKNKFLLMSVFFALVGMTTSFATELSPSKRPPTVSGWSDIDEREKIEENVILCKRLTGRRVSALGISLDRGFGRAERCEELSEVQQKFKDLLEDTCPEAYAFALKHSPSELFFVDDEGRTPLHYMALNGDDVVLTEWLLKNHVFKNVNAFDTYGHAPAHYAAMRGHREIIGIFIKHNKGFCEWEEPLGFSEKFIQFWNKNKLGHTAVQYAEALGYHEIVKDISAAWMDECAGQGKFLMSSDHIHYLCESGFAIRPSVGCRCRRARRLLVARKATMDSPLGAIIPNQI